MQQVLEQMGFKEMERPRHMQTLISLRPGLRASSLKGQFSSWVACQEKACPVVGGVCVWY